MAITQGVAVLYFSDRLDRVRERRRLTQAAAAVVDYVSEQPVAKMREAGLRPVEGDTLRVV